MVSCWYTRKEIALRNVILYVANYLASACAGLIAAAVFATMDGSLGIAGWNHEYRRDTPDNNDISQRHVGDDCMRVS